MERDKKRILIAKWFERLGLLAAGSLVFQGLFSDGGFAKIPIIIGVVIMIIAYGFAFYFLQKS